MQPQSCSIIRSDATTMRCMEEYDDAVHGRIRRCSAWKNTTMHCSEEYDDALLRRIRRCTAHKNTKMRCMEEYDEALLGRLRRCTARKNTTMRCVEEYADTVYSSYKKDARVYVQFCTNSANMCRAVFCSLSTLRSGPATRFCRGGDQGTIHLGGFRVQGFNQKQYSTTTNDVSLPFPQFTSPLREK